jgi:1,4-dihydroxy-2-naphthoyl-CoA hydrolase
MNFVRYGLPQLTGGVRAAGRAAVGTLSGRGERDFGEVRMDQETLEKIMATTVAEGTLPGRMGIKILSASASRVVATMPAEGNIQPQGLLHGGASCVLAETIGSLGAFLHAGEDRMVVGIEISATHHRGVREGEVTAVATLVHGGRTLATYDIVVTDAGGHRVCTSRLTCLIREQAHGLDLNGADEPDNGK